MDAMDYAEEIDQADAERWMNDRFLNVEAQDRWLAEEAAIAERQYRDWVYPAYLEWCEEENEEPSKDGFLAWNEKKTDEMLAGMD